MTPTEFGDFGAHLFRAFATAIKMDRDVRATLREDDGHDAPELPARPGDEGDFSGKVDGEHSV